MTERRSRSRIAGAAVGLVVGLAALAVVACEDAGQCASDNDCPSMQACVDGACAPLELAPTTRGTCGADSDCSAGEVCRGGRCDLPEDADACSGHGDPACAEGTVCAVAADASCEGDGCRLPLACVPHVGETKGLYRCAADAECRSGLCVDGGCLRTCTDVGSCPGAAFDCRRVTVSGRGEVSACVGLDRAGQPDPAQTLCTADAECPEGRACRIRSELEEAEVSVCEPRPVGLLVTGANCFASDSCESNRCVYACGDGISRVCQDCALCSSPCRTDADCPDRLICSEFRHENGHGDGTANRWCRLAFEGCFDDIDCCPSKSSEDGLCVGGWGLAEASCAYREVQGHVLSQCDPPDDGSGQKLAGELCDGPADCASGYCIPAHPGWTPPAPVPPLPPDGWKVCTSACDPWWDRCSLTRYTGSRCQGYNLELGGRAVTLPLCQ